MAISQFMNIKVIFQLKIDDNWNSFKILAHGFGVNSLSWSPVQTSFDNNGLLNQNSISLRFASCGMDNQIKIWKTEESNSFIQSFFVETTFDAHEDVVRDVSWRTCKNSNLDIIASGGDVYFIVIFKI
jgi:WD40 repeat protein